MQKSSRLTISKALKSLILCSDDVPGVILPAVVPEVQGVGLIDFPLSQPRAAAIIRKCETTDLPFGRAAEAPCERWQSKSAPHRQGGMRGPMARDIYIPVTTCKNSLLERRYARWRQCSDAQQTTHRSSSSHSEKHRIQICGKSCSYFSLENTSWLWRLSSVDVLVLHRDVELDVLASFQATGLRIVVLGWQLHDQ